MIAASTARRGQLHTIGRFLQTPKGYLLVILGILAAAAMPSVGVAPALASLTIVAATAATLDLAWTRLREARWIFPDGGLITGLIIALVLSPTEPWYVPLVAAVLAIASKYLLRTRWANIFNPAALALVASSILFGSAQSWWGALANEPAIAMLLLGALGLFMVQHMNKAPLVLAFLGGYFLLFTGAAFAGQASGVAEVFRAPDLQAALFFAAFMLDDPPTCPVRYSDQVCFGLIVAGVSIFVYLQVGAVYYLSAGLLVGNLWEAARRAVMHASARTASVRAR